MTDHVGMGAIASKAEQSGGEARRPLDCFVALAPRNDRASRASGNAQE